MIIVRVQGGLGNQISQYAFSRYLKIIYKEIEVKLDTSYFDEFHTVDFQLDHAFKKENMKYKIASYEDIEKVTGMKGFGCKKRPFVTRARNYAVRTMQKKCNLLPYIYQDISDGYIEDKSLYHLDKKRHWYFDGTWQNINYNSILHRLQNELQFQTSMETLPDSDWIKLIEDNESVAIHVRLGDYLDCADLRNILQNSQYYQNAVKLMRRRFKNPVFILFSNEIEKAAAFIGQILDNYVFFPVSAANISDWQQMFLMTRCKGIICGNSTYSYWGAMLGYQKDKTILFPEYYTRGRKTWKNAFLETVSLE